MIEHALHLTRFELRGLMRNRRARFFGLIFPVVLLAILSAAFGAGHVTVEGQRISMSRFYLPGILALTVTTACFASLTGSIVNRRQLGVLKRRRAAPIPAWLVVVSSSLATSLMAIAGAALMLVMGRFGYHVGIPAGTLGAAAIIVVVACLSFCAVAYAVASVIPSPDSVEPIIRFVTFPLFFVSGIWFPVSGLPAGVRAIADAFPVKHLADGLHRAFAHGSLASALSLADLAVLAAWGIVAAVIATRRFTWLPARATA